MKSKIAVLAGDGIGPEIMDEAIKVLNCVAEIFSHDFHFENGLIGGAAYDEFGVHFPEETANVCGKSDAILFGAVGGAVDKQMEGKWRNCETNSILALRKRFDFNVNLRPVKVYRELMDRCVLRPEIVADGVDILCVRELSQDVYFGKHETVGVVGERRAMDEMVYSEKVVEKIARRAFEIAMLRRKRVVSVDKANVLDCSKLWREVVNNVARDFPECELGHILVDNMAMQILKRPCSFDVILMPNMFGDIISDEASVLAGSLGLLPSASLNGEGFGLYEPSSGSAPDIAGMGIANPIGMILSAAMMLLHSFGLQREHDSVLLAVEKVLVDGYRTKDIAGEGSFVSTSIMGDLITNNIKHYV